MNATAFDVFDVHHHVGRAFDALGGELATDAEEGAEFARVELADRLRIMDEGGVRQALVIPGHGYLRPDGIAATRRVNNEIAAYRDATPDRFPAACGIVEPRDGAAALHEIDRAAGELGLVALSFHTRFQGVSLDSLWIVRYLERMGEVGLVPLLHAMDDTPEESLWKLAVTPVMPGSSASSRRGSSASWLGDTAISACQGPPELPRASIVL